MGRKVMLLITCEPVGRHPCDLLVVVALLVLVLHLCWDRSLLLEPVLQV